MNQELLLQPNKKAILTWLYSGIFLIMAMVVVGGITRLTESGLSITEWKVISGTLPPLTDAAWEKEFSAYQQSPEFKIKNFDMSLSDFKFIFFWEYIHRLIGRLIGIVFILPFVYFKLTGQFTQRQTRKLWVSFILGGFQGFLGWYMVKSGLVNRPDVSHFRLAAHLITAFITCAYIFWLSLEWKHEAIRPKWSLNKAPWILILLVITQIIYGAFVAGLDAGRIYNTFPMMGDSWLADAATTYTPWLNNWINNPAGIQFVHRCMAYLVAGLIIWTYWKMKSNVEQVRKAQTFLIFMVIVQFLLGMFTLLYSVPIVLGVLHQIGAFFLLMGCVYYLYVQALSKKSGA